MPKIGQFTDDEAKAVHQRAYNTLAQRWPVPSTISDIETSFGTTRVRGSGGGGGVPILLLPGISGNGMVWHRFI